MARLLLVCLLMVVILASWQTATAEENAAPDQVFPVVRDGKQGFIDRYGKVVVDFQFKPRGWFFGGNIDPLKPIGWQYLADRVMSDYVGDHIPWPDGIAIIEGDDGYGYIRRDGSILVPPQFERAGDFRDGIAWVLVDGKCRMLNTSGKLLDLVVDDCWRFHERRAAIAQDGKWGFVDPGGNIVIAAAYDEVEDFRQGLALVRQGKKWGVVNLVGEEIVEPRYSRIYHFEDGVAMVKQSGKYGFISSTGRVLIEPKYDLAAPRVSEGIVLFGQQKKWGAGDLLGNRTIDFRFDFMLHFSDGRAAIEVDHLWGYIDLYGRVIVPPTYAQADPYKNGVAIVKNASDRYGLLGLSGEVIVEPSLSRLEEFSHGVAPFAFDRLMGLISDEGKVLLEPKYEYIGAFGAGGFHGRTVDGGTDILSHSGELISELEYSRIRRVATDLYSFSNSQNRRGLMDASFRVVVPAQYGFIDEFQYGLARVNRGGHESFAGPVIGGEWIYIDRAGKVIWEP